MKKIIIFAASTIILLQNMSFASEENKNTFSIITPNKEKQYGMKLTPAQLEAKQKAQEAKTRGLRKKNEEISRQHEWMRQQAIGQSEKK